MIEYYTIVVKFIKQRGDVSDPFFSAIRGKPLPFVEQSLWVYFKNIYEERKKNGRGV